MADLLLSKKTFQELGIICMRAVRLSGNNAWEYTVWFRDGKVLNGIIS